VATAVGGHPRSGRDAAEPLAQRGKRLSPGQGVSGARGPRRDARGPPGAIPARRPGAAALGLVGGHVDAHRAPVLAPLAGQAQLARFLDRRLARAAQPKQPGRPQHPSSSTCSSSSSSSRTRVAGGVLRRLLSAVQMQEDTPVQRGRSPVAGLGETRNSASEQVSRRSRVASSSCGRRFVSSSRKTAPQLGSSATTGRPARMEGRSAARISTQLAPRQGTRPTRTTVSRWWPARSILLPAARAAGPDSLIVTDGFSCRRRSPTAATAAPCTSRRSSSSRCAVRRRLGTPIPSAPPSRTDPRGSQSAGPPGREQPGTSAGAK